MSGSTGFHEVNDCSALADTVNFDKAVSPDKCLVFICHGVSFLGLSHVLNRELWLISRCIPNAGGS